MNKLILLLFFSAIVQTVFGGEIEINTKVENVTIYHSGALVTRSGLSELKPGINELVFKNLSSKIILSSLKVNNKEVTILNKILIRKLSKEEMSQLLDKKDALNKQLTLIETKFNETGFVTKVEDLKTMTTFYSEKIQQLKKEIRDTERKIEEAKKLEDINLKNENAGILKLIVSVEGILQESFKMQYVCGGIGWSPAYEVVIESSSKNTIEVKYLAKAMSQTGEDWDNISINLSSSFPLESPNDLPKPKNPWLLEADRYNNNNNLHKQNEIKYPLNTEQQQIDKLEGVTYNEISIPSFLKLRPLKDKFSLKSNSTVFTFPIKVINLPATFYYYGYPGVDPEVYLVAQLIGWDTLGFVDGIANVTFGGNSIGKSVLKFSETKDTLLFPVGKDNSVYMKRNEIADQKYFKISSIGKKRETKLAYRYELKNNNPFPIKFELTDQFPISQTKSAEVEVEEDSNGNLNKETGEVVWFMELKPGQTLQKELIFSIEMDGNYKYYKGDVKGKYKTISAPSF